MIIVQISDSHIAADHPMGAARAEALARCVADINALDPQPDAVIHTGDMAQHGRPEEYETARAILDGLRAPFYPAAGNRDDEAALLAAFAGRPAPLATGMPFVQYAADLGPLRLIALDTRSSESNQGTYCAERIAQLGALLAEDESKPAVAFMHHPPFEIPASLYPFQFESRQAAGDLGAALSDGRRVVRAFCGHAHRPAAGLIGAVPASTVPSLAIDLRLGDYPAGMEASPFYQIHRFNGAWNAATELRAAKSRSERN